MKTVRRLVASAAFVPLLFTTFSAYSAPVIQPPEQYAKSGDIRFCSTFQNPPYNYKEDGKPTGLATDLADAIAGLMGLKVNWIQFQFSDLIPSLLSGQCDMIAHELYIKPEREKVIAMIPFAISAEQIVTRKGNGQGIETIADLSGKKVATDRGATFHSLLMEENKKLSAEGKPQVEILAVPSANATFTNVLSGTVDAGGATVAAVAYFSEKTSGRLEKAGAPFHEIKDGLGVKKDNTALRDAVTKGLDHLRQNGEYAKLFEKYQMTDAMLHSGAAK